MGMLGFVGYIVHENGIRWPFLLCFAEADYSRYEGLSAPDVWDALPAAARWQIILFVGALEVWSEAIQYTTPKENLQTEIDRKQNAHYMRGGRPGRFPSFKEVPFLPFDLYDPFGERNEKLQFGAGLRCMTEEQKSRRLIMEVNNGRLAMIGLMGFCYEAMMPGSVPALAGVVKPYAGNIWIPWGMDYTMF